MERLTAVFGRSRWVSLGGVDVHYLDFSGTPGAEVSDDPAIDRPTVVCVHGLGGSYANWLALGPLLRAGYRVLALDLAGFGLTRVQGRPSLRGWSGTSTSIAANTGLVTRFVAEVVGGPAIWVGNSMGALITALAAAKRPDLVRAAALIAMPWLPRRGQHADPAITAMFTAYMTPGLGTALVAGRRRLVPAETLARESLAACCADVSRVPDDVVCAHVELTRERSGYPEVVPQFLHAARSTVSTLGRRQWLDAAFGQIEAPVLMLHGEQDRFVPIAAARELAAAQRSWTFVEREGLGHTPQLEDAAWTADQLTGWMRGRVPAPDAVPGRRPETGASITSSKQTIT